MSLEAICENSAFDGAGICPGYELWRVEENKLVRYPDTFHYKFFEDDSYLILDVCKFFFYTIELYFLFLFMKFYRVSLSLMI